MPAILQALLKVLGITTWAGPILVGLGKAIGPVLGKIGSWIGKGSKVGKSIFQKGGLFGKIGQILEKLKKFREVLWNGWVFISVKIAWFVSSIWNLLRKGGLVAVLITCLGRFVGFFLRFVKKHPVLAGIFLIANDWFPTALETIFRLVGNVTLEIMVPIFKAMMKAAQDISKDEVEEFTETMKSSFAGLPDCIGSILGFLNVQSCIGMIVTAWGLCMTFQILVKAYGAFK